MVGFCFPKHFKCSLSLLYYSCRYLDCIQLDKFEAYDSEFKLENRSVELINGSKYWAAIVFNDSIGQMKKLPSHVSYKIRMNTDKVSQVRISFSGNLEVKTDKSILKSSKRYCYTKSRFQR